MIGPRAFSRYLESQGIGQTRRIDTITGVTLSAMAAAIPPTASNPRSLVCVGNAGQIRRLDLETQIGATVTAPGFGAYNFYAVNYSQAFTSYLAVGQTDALFSSPDGTTWTNLTTLALGFVYYAIDSATDLAVTLIVGGLDTGGSDGLYRMRYLAAGVPTIYYATAPGIFKSVVYSPAAQRFICANETTVYRFNPFDQTWTLLETHPEGTCTLMDSFYSAADSSVYVVLRLPTGTLRCTLVTGSAMTVTRSLATALTFTTAVVMRGAGTRYNGPLYLFSGEGSPRMTSGLLSAAAVPPADNRAYDPQRATTHYPRVIGDSLLRSLVRSADVHYLLVAAATEHRIYQSSDALPA
jgi:hypothetical protein